MRAVRAHRRGLLAVGLVSALGLTAIVRPTPPAVIPTPVLAAHPRLYLTPARLAALKARAAQDTPEWRRFIGAYNGVTRMAEHYGQTGIPPRAHFIPQLALAYLVTDDPDYATAGVAALMHLLEQDLDPGGSFTKMGALAEQMEYSAIGFDWLYAQLTPAQRAVIVARINRYTALLMPDYPYPWHGRSTRHMLAVGLCGYATSGDNPQAQTLIDHARHERFEKLVDGMNRLFGAGGGWVNGDFYAFTAVPNILQYAEAVRTATGEDLYMASPWFADRLAYRLSATYPGTFYDANPGRHYDGTFGGGEGTPYLGYYTAGDGHRGMAGMTDRARLEALLLINRFPDTAAAKQLQWLLTRSPHDRMRYRAHHEWLDLLWVNPGQPAEPPTLLAHAAPGVGLVTMRSDWSPEATWIAFQCGDIFSAAHAHLDQNSFSIFRRGDLAIKSGLYDGSGAWTDHNVNYYSRTIASNSVLVYDPDETFGPWRARHHPAVRNDGGQRANRGDHQEYRDVDQWLQFRDRQDTGDLLRYDHAPDYTYVAGDATNAYNNPRYISPGQGGPFATNRQKITHFTRELVYLRPHYVVVFDRVHATRAAFLKKWLLHTLEEPAIDGQAAFISDGEWLYDGDTTVARAGEGTLVVTTLLPEAHRIRKVGGRGVKDYWVFGANLPLEPGTTTRGEEYGAWRVEVEPMHARKEDVFLHVLHPTDRPAPTRPTVTRLDALDGQMRGALIADATRRYVALFHARPGEAPGEIAYTLGHGEESAHWLFNLDPAARAGDYHITVTESGVNQTIAIARAAQPGTGVHRGVQDVRKTDQGVLRFTVRAGSPAPSPAL